MRVRFSDRGDLDYESLPPQVRKSFEKQLQFLIGNLHHPSLRAKKYDTGHDRWQARVNRSWRFYFLIDGDEYVIASIVPHPK